MSINEVLGDANAIRDAYATLQKRAAVEIPDPGKSWDLLKAFEFIVSQGHKDSRVLDMGTRNCRLLELLAGNGFRRLYGCDVAPLEWRRLIRQHRLSGQPLDLLKGIFGFGPIKISRQDLQKTDFPDGTFDFIASLSVIEHGIDLRAYFKESARLLVPGGYLITSCDYWPEKIDTSGITLFDTRWEIFSKDEVEGMARISPEYGLQLCEPIDYTHGAPAVDSNGKQYTFLFFVMQKLGR